MFSHQLYNLVHIVGIALLMAGLAGVAFLADASGGLHRRGWQRRTALAFHGSGLFLILLGGFGMLARLGIVAGSSWPGWVWAKVVVWGALGAIALLPLRRPRTALPVLLLLPVLGGLAAYMAIYKPF